jgi:hypothetical protein
MSLSLSLTYSNLWSDGETAGASGACRPESPTPAVRISGKLDGFLGGKKKSLYKSKRKTRYPAGIDLAK